jgi:hypothetical protein
MPVSADYITSQKSNSQPHLNFEPKAKKEKELPKRAGDSYGTDDGGSKGGSANNLYSKEQGRDTAQ